MIITLAQLRKVNAEFRASDQSHLAPINNRFNVTELAIRQCAELRKEVECSGPYEYRMMLGQTISNILNSPSSW